MRRGRQSPPIDTRLKVPVSSEPGCAGRSFIDRIRRWITRKLYRCNRALPEHRRFRNAMHAVHHMSICRQDDWIGKIDRLDAVGVFDDSPARRREGGIEPVHLVKLVQAAECNRDMGQRVGQVDQAVNIPTLRPSFGSDALMKLWHCSSHCPPKPIRLSGPCANVCHLTWPSTISSRWRGRWPAPGSAERSADVHGVPV
jgi:hypothetical protein